MRCQNAQGPVRANPVAADMDADVTAASPAVAGASWALERRGTVWLAVSSAAAQPLRAGPMLVPSAPARGRLPHPLPGSGWGGGLLRPDRPPPTQPCCTT